jgi:hypothetical protein
MYNNTAPLPGEKTATLAYLRLGRLQSARLDLFRCYTETFRNIIKNGDSLILQTDPIFRQFGFCAYHVQDYCFLLNHYNLQSCNTNFKKRKLHSRKTTH